MAIGKVNAGGGGTNTKDATALAEDILLGKSAYVAEGKVEGTMANNGAVSKSIAPSSSSQTYTIPAGYHNGSGKVTVSAIIGTKGPIRSASTALSTIRYLMAATTVGSYALFGGGYKSSYFSVVDAYDTSLTRSTPTALSTSRSYLAATTVGSYALFGGGSSNKVVDVYDTSLTKSTSTEFSIDRYRLSATTVGSYALFGGDSGSSSSSSLVIDAYSEKIIA